MEKQRCIFKRNGDIIKFERTDSNGHDNLHIILQTLMNVLITLVVAIKPATTPMDHFTASVMSDMYCLKIGGHVEILMSVQ